MKPSIVVIDYQKGNLKSVERGLIDAGASVCVTADAEIIASAAALVLPGVGAFGDASQTMEELGQREAVLSALEHDAAFLGICLGLHLMYEQGEECSLSADGEGLCEVLPQGLGLLPGTCRRIPRTDDQGRVYKVPHVGWNTLELKESSNGARLWESCPLMKEITPGEYFYFTHSYQAPTGAATVAETQHSYRFPSVVALNDHCFGVQFHPEKSSESGARLLRNFVAIVRQCCA